MRTLRGVRGAWYTLLITLILLIPAACSLPGGGLPPPGQETPVPPDSGGIGNETLIPTPTPNRLVIRPENVVNLQTVGRLSEPGAQTFSWLPGEPALAVAGEENISLYEIAPPTQTDQVPADRPALLTTSPDQQMLAWVNAENQVHVLDAADPQQPELLDGFEAAVTGLAFSPQGDNLAAATYENEIQVLDVSTGAAERTWEIPNWLTNLTYSPDGSRIAGADLQNFAVYIFDAATGELLNTLTYQESASPALYGAFFSPDWERVAWVARGTVQLMDVETGELGPALLHEDFVNSTAWSPDGRLIATSAAATINDEFSPVVLLWDAQTGEQVRTIAQPEVTLSLSFSPDGRGLGTLYSNGTLQIWAVTR